MLAPFLLLPLAGAEKSTSATRALASPPGEPSGSSGNWLSSLLFKPFDPNPDMEMTVVTEMTEAGRKLPEVTAEHPAYYQAESSGDREMGDLISHEQTLPPEEVGPLLTRSLKVNGYQPASAPDHPPSLLVIYFWGTHNAIIADSPDQTTFRQVFNNVIDRATLVGGRKFSDEVTGLVQQVEDLREAHREDLIPTAIGSFRRRKVNNDQLLNLTLGDVFYVVASAFDYPSVAKGQPVLLWRTHMSVMAQGVQMKKAVPAVVASAGQYFGREMAEPAVIHHSATPEGKVDVGKPTVVGEGK